MVQITCPKSQSHLCMVSGPERIKDQICKQRIKKLGHLNRKRNHCVLWYSLGSSLDSIHKERQGRDGQMPYTEI